MSGERKAPGIKKCRGKELPILKAVSMYLRQMISFFIKASSDHRIGPLHVAIYMALFQQWCISGENPVSVSMLQVAQVAKVGRTTYHKCIRELNEYGYIQYTPSYSPSLKSMVLLVELNL